MITDLWDRLPCAASDRSNSGRVSPPTARPPNWRNERRETPSQKRDAGPNSASMIAVSGQSLPRGSRGGRKRRVTSGRVVEGVYPIGRGWAHPFFHRPGIRPLVTRAPPPEPGEPGAVVHPP